MAPRDCRTQLILEIDAGLRRRLDFCVAVCASQPGGHELIEDLAVKLLSEGIAHHERAWEAAVTIRERAGTRRRGRPKQSKSKHD